MASTNSGEGNDWTAGVLARAMPRIGELEDVELIREVAEIARKKKAGGRLTSRELRIVHDVGTRLAVLH